MSPIDASPDAFHDRTGRYLAAAAKAATAWYDASGKWIAPSLPADNRERLWGCFGLYAAGNRELADAVVRAGDAPRYRDMRYNIFDTNIAAALLVAHRDEMAADVRTKLEQLVRDGFCFKPGNRQPDYQFHGYNDNMPAKATMGLILGGELLDEAAPVEYGLWNLRQLRAMLVRRGINSEYNSPTYSALTIHAMGEIAQHARHPEAQALALAIEQRLWLDLAARFHPETGFLAGPNSRAYTVDTIGQISCVSALLWFTLGDLARPSPMLLFAPPPGLVVHHMGDYPFNIAQMCWYAGGSFHIPPAALAMFQRKSYPFRAVATAEMGDAGLDFPARPIRIETMMREDFTQGTASSPFCGGEQTMSWFVTYRQRVPATSHEDTGTVFTKLMLDAEEPGEITGPGDQWRNRGEADHAHSYASTFPIQADTAALVLTHPHLRLGGEPDTGKDPKPVKRLSDLVIFPTHFGGVDEIVVGGQRRTEWDGPVPRGAWIVCRRGRLLIGIRPLVYTRTLGEPLIRLERLPRYDLIRTTFYDGEARTFSRQELRHVFSGFVAELASVDEYGSAEEFARILAASGFTDYFWTTRRVRYRRPASELRPALDIETSWSPGSLQPRYATVNGQPIDWPVVAIDGLKDKDFPFLTEPFDPVPGFFPWRDFSVEWGDWPSAIGDRETPGEIG